MTITTPRLTIRAATRNDASEVHKTYQDPAIVQYTAAGSGPLSVVDVGDIIHRENARMSNNVGRWVVLRTSDGAFLGTIRLNRDAEVTISVLSAYCGNGYGSEAMYHFCKEILKQGHFPKLVGIVDPANSAVQALNQKIGMGRVSQNRTDGKWVYEAELGKLVDPNP